MDYLTLKKQVLNKYFSRTNDMQKKAVFRINGAVLIVAGAGSGKTTVLCNRIANMLLFGNAYNSNTVRELSDDDIAFAQSFLAGEIDNLMRLSVFRRFRRGQSKAVDILCSDLYE